MVKMLNVKGQMLNDLSAAKAVKRAAGANVNRTVRNCRCREAFIVQLVYGQYLPLTIRFQNGNSAALADDEHLSIGSNR
jgi:hypothetical protein